MVATSLLLSFSLLLLQPARALWPEPTSLSMGSNPLFINRDIKVTYNGEQLQCNELHEPSTIDSKAIVQSGASRAIHTIFNQGLYPWMFHPRNETDTFQPSPSNRSFLTSLTITQDGKDNASTFKPLAGQVDESYELAVTMDGKSTIKAHSSIGILRALETFTQLFYTGYYADKKKEYYTPYVPVKIEDGPKYHYRGLMLDTSRNFYPVESMFRTIDGCAASKLNTLHWHITDAQAWPLVIPAMPELSAKGAYRPDMVYTPDDVKRIQRYGIARGVQVNLEIDQPGHISALGWSHPELLTAYNYEPYNWMCGEPPCGQLRLNDSDKVDPFLDTLMDDLLPRLAPYSAYFSNGGDEIVANDSAIDPSVGTNSSEVVADLLQKFTDKSLARVRKAGMTPMVWEELPVQWNVSLGEDTVVTTWLGEASVKSATSKGYKVVDANLNYLYLSCGRGSWYTYQPGESYKSGSPFVGPCKNIGNWEHILSYNPAAGLSPEQAKKVIGSETAVWSETINDVILDSLTWPSASVLGEVLWTGPLGPDGSDGTRNQITAAPRISELQYRLVERGIGAYTPQMPFCTQGGNCTMPA